MNLLLSFLSAFFRSRYHLGLEILSLRQQLGVLKRKHPRPQFRVEDRIFWILLRRLWPAWSRVVVIVKPETVVAWHRAGFRLFCRLRSRPKSLGRPSINIQIRTLIQHMVNENSTWGAPRIHGELLKLGFQISERTVSRYLGCLYPRDKARQLWSAFLRNHRELIAAMDFFTVPTITFRVLYSFFVIEHGRRRILHFNVTQHPTSLWIVQQLREALPDSCPYRYMILDRDGKYGQEVTDFLADGGVIPKRISAACPWQNGIAERWISSCRHELLYHVLAMNEAHLRRLIRDYVSYYNADRIHDSLEKDTPSESAVSLPAESARLQSFPRLGGLHHRYDWQRAA